jgi:hypothetical protein
MTFIDRRQGVVQRRSADVVNAIDREKVAALMIRLSIATGHGDTIDDLISELEAAIVDRCERYYERGVDDGISLVTGRIERVI